MKNKKKLIRFLMSLLIPIVILALVSLPTPASNTLYLYDYVMLFNRKATKGSYIELVSMDANNEVFFVKI